MIKKVFTIFLVVGIALILNSLDIRICPFFNLFNIPCVGCGMTRAVKLIFEFKFMKLNGFEPEINFCHACNKLINKNVA